ncbi:glycosyltransferase [Sphingomonas faeni]|uniref:glycosyltransferase n=1 Tax=Sphingomonas faeni TaxID=185950 RepID=UPI00277D18CA|nr:glycosyltransferase [Sphingomonas faeni]MDQ0839836.1 hypothetical protein [Sphingomonas faeni]
MSNVRVSFVVATFNGAIYVEEQLHSILAALGEEDEVIVSDDGSSDGTIERVRAINDPRIYVVIGDVRLGYQGNFARAISAARGRYIFFSDQDDVCLPARVPLSLEALEGASCVCGDAVVVDQNLDVLHASHFMQRGAKFSALSIVMRPSVIGATLACTRAFLMRHLPFPEGVPHDMWLSFHAARIGQLAVVREPFILYRRHGTALSATGAVSKRSYLKRIRERLLLINAVFRGG